MRISLRELTLDGVGPFGERQHIELSPTGKTVIYAPNGHGKTAMIDLVRWLFLGDAAQPEFRSIDGVINKARAKSASRSGYVEALLDVEGRGLYRIRRITTIGVPSRLETSKQDGWGGWQPDPNPEAFLLRFFPRERIGFNLLTGEHIREFAKEVREARVKESVEKLLRFPEIASANNALSTLANLTEKREADARALKKSARAAADKAARLGDELRSLDAKIEDAEGRKEQAAAALAELVKQIGALENTEAPAARLAELEALVKKQYDAQVRSWENIQVILAPAWKPLVKAAAGRHSARLIEEDERHQQRLREWAMRQGEVRQYREILALAECICTRPVDDALRTELERRISVIEQQRPVAPPETPVPIHMLKGWKDNDEVASLIERLRRAYDDYTIVDQDMAELDKQTEAQRRKVKGSNPEQLRELQRQRLRQERAVESIENEIRGLAKKREALQSDVSDARRKAAKEAGTEGVLQVAGLVEGYRRAFQELVTLSVPYYRRKLEERVQEIFTALYQKDPSARISFEGSSYLPRIRRNDGGAPSEGEKLRLGIALLLAFRDVAAEQPFLFLDAPFAELDDEGTDRLLTLLADQDSQIIILTKNRLPREPFQIVRRMKPVTYEMEFHQATSMTSIKVIPVENLLRSDNR